MDKCPDCGAFWNMEIEHNCPHCGLALEDLQDAETFYHSILHNAESELYETLLNALEKPRKAK